MECNGETDLPKGRANRLGHLLGRQERDPLLALPDQLQQRARDVQKGQRRLP